MRTLRSIAIACSTVKELLAGLWCGPFWWLVPLVVLLLPAAVVFVFLQITPAVAPFVYTIL